MNKLLNHFQNKKNKKTETTKYKQYVKKQLLRQKKTKTKKTTKFHMNLIILEDLFEWSVDQMNKIEDEEKKTFDRVSARTCLSPFL